ncbi:DNA-binding protein YbiB [Melaminivora sp.]|uniref:DNA-binding protein YbiB n=1 Tax=Melaminivora sp. TaxID=1933032 RepID=UPI0028ADE8AD|nr:DNA-binding protein YbiB [Melaminivora sp.]
MGISHYLKDIGRGARGAQALDRAQAADLFGQLLDGQATDLEVGAFCLAMRIKGETAEEMCGFLDAVQARMALLPPSPGVLPLVVLPSYNGARRLPVLTPLLALLLAREGLPVLLHGMRTEERRVTAPEVLQALGVPALASATAVAPGAVAHLASAALLPGLARLLTVREVIGLRTPAHSVAKLLAPCAGPTLVVTSHTHADYLDLTCAVAQTRAMHLFVSRGLEGEVAADPRRQARHDGFVAGRQVLASPQEPGTADSVPGLPAAIDAVSTGHYTRAVLAGDLPVPAPLARQVRHIMQLARQVGALNQESLHA